MNIIYWANSNNTNQKRTNNSIVNHLGSRHRKREIKNEGNDIKSEEYALKAMPLTILRHTEYKGFPLRFNNAPDGVLIPNPCIYCVNWRIMHVVIRRGEYQNDMEH